jgi:hypothetical protein
MPTYRIRFENPETQETEEVTERLKNFEEANALGYALADKGRCKIWQKMKNQNPNPVAKYYWERLN